MSSDRTQSRSPPEESAPPAKVRAYLELVRLPNVPTAIADVAMGFLFVRLTVGPEDGWTLGMLVAASGLLYAAGMVLNDLFDFQTDLEQRPDRPLPSGRVSRRAAGWLGWGLLLAGVVSAWLAAVIEGNSRPGVVAALLAGCVGLYDGYLKRTPLGPPTMGTCRMLNVLLGMSVAATPFRDEHWLVAGAVGTYIAGLTWLGRTEYRRSSRMHLLAATVVMMLGIGLLAWLPNCTENLVELIRLQPNRWRLLMAIVGMLIGWRCLRAVIEPTPYRVQAAVKHGILSLVVLDAAACFAACGLFWAVIILLLLVPAMFLGQWIYST